MLEIVFVTPEVAPFSKTGGLADVSEALPAGLARLGHSVTIVTPMYGSIDKAALGIDDGHRLFDVDLGPGTAPFNVFEAQTPAGVPVYFLANDSLFGRAELYGTRDGALADNHLRFGFFSAAVFRLLRSLRLHPDVIHCNDWQTSLVPVYNRIWHKDMAGTVLTIHNLAYQGLFPGHTLTDLGMEWDVFNPEGVEYYGQVGFLKAGLKYADKITTVSPGYAREVLTPDRGCGLDGVLRARGRDFSGILNGIDVETWNPEDDAYLSNQYGREDLGGKARNKLELMREFGLSDYDGPLFGVVGRLTQQKGYDLLAGELNNLINLGGSLVALGTGDHEVEDMFTAVAGQFPGRVGFRIAYDEKLAHLIEAGADFFVMPSRYEPCGLNQLYSLRYGTLPVVHAVGGLGDTVIDVDENPMNGNGLTFRGFTSDGLIDALRRAVNLYRDQPHMNAIRTRAMEIDNSWEASARKYVGLYSQIAR